MIRSLRRAADHRRQADGRYGWLFNPYTGDEMVAIGCETSGLDPRSAGLVSIGAVRLTSERVLAGDSLNLDLHGGDPGEPAALGNALEMLLDFIGNRPLLGWRIGFDRAVIDRHLRPHFGFDLPNATLDMAQIYRREMRRASPRHGSDPRFEALTKRIGVPQTSQRSALDDALTTASVYVQLKKDALAAHRH
ncbi:MAG TPA: 3'-5' exonuclease [Modicisalibacter sp.]|nr:3'-5' exonuclease [Modicisalibacter sp.]